MPTGRFKSDYGGALEYRLDDSTQKFQHERLIVDDCNLDWACWHEKARAAPGRENKLKQKPLGPLWNLRAPKPGRIVFR